MKLGNRMAAIAAMVPAGSRVADIGTDHAYLPIYLIETGVATGAVAGDIHQGPFRSAETAVSKAGLEEQISVRLGDGFAVMSPGEADTVIIAGMGGASIIDILTSRPEVTGALSRLVLQPMLAAGSVRGWLIANGWRLVDEALAEEDGRLYEIIAAEQGQSAEYEPILLEIGPLLWQRRHPLLKAHLTALIGQLKRIVGEMAGSAQAAGSAKFREYQEKIALLEDRYTCL